MELGIQGKRAFVTGAGRGVGRGVALSLAREGAKVAVVARTAEDIESVVKEMGGREKGHYGLSMDLMEDDTPEMLTKELQINFGHVDILVHSLGGTMGINDPFCNISEWRKVWRFNLEIAIELNRILIPKMKEMGWGRVVHISSIAAVLGQDYIQYSAVKAALNMYTKGLARFLAPYGVVVSAVMPGAIRYKGGHWDNIEINNPEYARKFLSEHIAIGRFAEVDEISGIVTYLCSEKASFHVGSIIPVDGGSR